MMAQHVSPEDHDAGFKVVPLEYKRGPAPEDFPVELRVTPVDHRHAGSLFQRATASADALLFVVECLPLDFRREDFLNRLTPACLGALTDVAFELTYGSSAMDKVKETAHAILAESMKAPATQAP